MKSVSIVFGLFLLLLSVNAADYSEQMHEGNAFDYTVNPGAVVERWNLDLSLDGSVAIDDFLRSSRPALSEDGASVFVFARDPSGNSGKIVAVDVFTGRKLWVCNVLSFVSYDSWSSPVYSKGYIYWAGSDGNGKTLIYKINARNGSCSEIDGGWSVQLPGSVNIVNASPTVGGGKVFISSYGGLAPADCCHYALDCVDGHIVWSNNDGGPGQGAMAYDNSRNVVYQTVLDTDYKLRAYNADDGTVLWSANWSFVNVPYFSSVTFKNDKIYLQDYNFNGDGRIYVADASSNGNLLWSQSTPVSGDSAPCVDDAGNVFVYGDWQGGGRTRGYDSNGVILWTNTSCGGCQGAPAASGDFIFSGIQGGNLLNILNRHDGVIVKSLPGGGPVAFGDRAFFTIGGDGILYAYSTGNDYASRVVSYTEGTGAGAFNISASALNRPTVDTIGDGTDIPEAEPVPVVNVYPPFHNTELVSVGVGGELILEFDHPVKNSKNNKYGVDFIIFGNSMQGVASGGAWTNRDPADTTTGGTLFREPAEVSVSQDGVTWFDFSSGPYADDFSPSFGRIYDTSSPYRPDTSWSWNNWWGDESDATLPLDPAWTPAVFDGKSVEEASLMCGDSAGGTGFDLAAVGLDYIKYIKISVPSTAGSASEVDAVADARIVGDRTPPAVPGNFLATVNDKDISLSWENPSDSDFSGVLILREKGVPVSGIPVDGTAYFEIYNSHISSADVVYCGSGTSFTDSSLLPGTYNYKIIAFDNLFNYSAGSDASDTIIEVKYRVVFQVDGTPGASISGNLSQLVVEGENSSTVTANAPAGYLFVNWTGSGSFSPVTDKDLTVYNVHEDFTITANFAIKRYTLSYSAGAHGSISGTTLQSVDYGSDGTSVEAIPDSGYHFLSWSDGVTTPIRTDKSVTNDISVTADFAVDGVPVYDLNVINGTGDGGYEEGVSVRIVADAPQDHYHFREWTGNGGSFSDSASPNTLFLMPGSDCEIIANFAIDSYSVLYAAGSGGYVSGPVSQNIDYGGDALSVTAVPSQGYHFDHWSDGVLTLSRRDLNITADLSVIADFAKNSYTLNYSADDGGLIQGLSNQNVLYGEDGGEVTAVPSEGYVFKSWSDGLVTATRKEINVTSDLSVTAVFELKWDKITSGSVITLLPGEIPGFNDNIFTKSPKIYGTYSDELKAKLRKASTKSITKISSSDGNTFYKALWNKNVLLYDKKNLRKSQKSGVRTDEWLKQYPMKSLVCNLAVKVKSTTGESLDTFFRVVQIVPPVVSGVLSRNGAPIPKGVHANSILMIRGDFFGAKLPSVKIECKKSDRVQYIKMKVLKEYLFSDYKGRGSCMDGESGESCILVQMPKETLDPGDYSLFMTNKLGIGVSPETGKLPVVKVIYESDNTAPIAEDDNVIVTLSSKKYIIDVLANDFDAESDMLTVKLPENHSTGGAKISVKNGKVYYYLPVNSNISSDSFSYIIDDGHFKNDTANVFIEIR